MKALIVVSLLASFVLGVSAPGAAQVGGPWCLEIAELGEIVEVFALPTGGGQMILTGRSLTFGDAYTGSAYVLVGGVVFSLASGLLPGVLEGAANVRTGRGTGSATFADTGQVQSLNYRISSPPCVRP